MTAQQRNPEERPVAALLAPDIIALLDEAPADIRAETEEMHPADLADVELPDDPDEETEFQQRGTRELLYRLRKQVPSVRSLQRRSGRRSMGTDIFS